MKSNLQKVSEHQVQSQILDYLRYNHFFFWRNNSGGLVDKRGILVRFGQVGSPDIMALKNGKFYAIEVKSATGKLSERQKMWLDEAKEYGAIVIVAHSLDEFMDELVVKETLKIKNL